MDNSRPFKYYAFISYKSEDVEWAMWLQHELEHYHLPASYNGRTDITQELRPVFRDLDELSAGNLPEQIQQALRDSKNLIVICSPQAVKSKWVNSEVETFISLGRTRNIFPFIVDGDSPSDFYPSSLLNLPQKEERLGGDVRISGRDAAFVKVVAGMLGLPFDSLWKRYEKEKAEDERKQREDRDRLYKIQSSYLAEKALELQNLGCLHLPVRLSIEALPNNLRNPNRPYTPIAERVLRFLTCTQQSYLLRHDIREDVCSIAYNAKKKFLASASESIIKIWAIETGQLIYERYFDRKIISIAFNSDGNKVTAASIGNHWSEVCIYELNIEKMECTILCEGNENCGLVVKKTIKENGVVLSHFSNTNILWELFHDQLLKNDITIIANKADFYSSMIYCHATKYLVLSQKERIYVYDRITLSLKYSVCVEGHSLVKVDDKEEFLILSYNNMIKVYCLKDGRFLFNHNSQDESVNAISCNKHSSSITYVTDKGVYNWNYINGDCHNYCCCDNISRINCLELLNKDSLICINEKNNIRFINMGYKLSISKIDNNISKLAFSNDGRIIAYSCENGPLFIRHLQSPNKKFGKRHLIFHETPKLILFSTNDKFIAIVVDNLIYIFRRNGKDYTLHAKLQGHEENIYAISFDKEAKNICSADSFDIKIWDIDTGKCIKSLHDDGQGLIFSVIFHPSEATIITTSYKQIKIWSIINGNCIKTLSGHANTVTCLSNNANGNYILSGSCDSTLRVWDYFSGKEKYIENTNMHHDSILCMNRSLDENYLLTSSDDGAIKIWHIEESSLALVYEIHFDERLISAQLCIHANKILVATQNGIYFVDFPPLQELINKYRHIFKNVGFTEEEKKQYYLN